MLFSLDEFKDKCMESAIKRDSCYNLLYASNALCGEAGELANYVKKVYRDNEAVLSQQTESDIKKEIFDVMWYCAYLADILDTSFEEICYLGFRKLQERANNKLHGHGEV